MRGYYGCPSIQTTWGERVVDLRWKGKYTVWMCRRRLRALEQENAKLKRLLADKMLDNAADLGHWPSSSKVWLFDLVHGLLKAEGLVVRRLYRIEGLQVRTKHSKKLARPREVPMQVPRRLNDQLVDGRRIWALSLLENRCSS